MTSPATPVTLDGPLLAAVLAAYLLGSVPFGWLMARGLHGVDLRTVGSGNIGATNAMRVLGRPLGVAAFLLDFTKGWAPVFLLGGAEPWRQVLIGAAAIVGHVWPVYLRFRGGKAVATSYGVLLAVDPFVFLGAGLVWLATLGLSRLVSLASILMAISFPVLALMRMREGHYGWEVPLATAALAGLILVRHRSNLRRIVSGTEPRVGAKKPPEVAKG
jgi:acyl phosphate:glycerol-3-phosphate acyltransferase